MRRLMVTFQRMDGSWADWHPAASVDSAAGWALAMSKVTDYLRTIAPEHIPPLRVAFCYAGDDDDDE